MRKWLIILLLIVLAGCRSDADFATLTAIAENPTPTAEVWTPQPATETPVFSTPTPTPPTMIAPPPYIVHQWDGGQSMPPERNLGGWLFHIHDFAGTVHVTGDWMLVSPSQCYIAEAKAQVDLRDNFSEFAPDDFHFNTYVHFPDGSYQSRNQGPLRSGVFDDYSGYYELVTAFYVDGDGPAFMSWAFEVPFNNAGFGNKVTIYNVRFAPVSRDHCNQAQ
jgi:hypothetical protein